MPIAPAIRTLFKQPRFTIVASLTLALGVGATTAIFSVVNGVLLQPLPYPQPDRLVNVWSHAPKLGYDQFGVSPDLFFAYEQGAKAFESMALFERRRANLTGDSAPDVVETIVTTDSYFTTLGVTMVRGRGYTRAEDAPGAPRVTVISHRAWVSRFSGDPDIVGRSVRLDGEPTEIVGVASAALDSRGSPDFFLPTRMDRAAPIAGDFGWDGFGRLEPGVRLEDAQAQLAAVVPRFMETLRSANYRAFLKDGDFAPRLHLMKEDLVGALERPLWILLATVGMLLIVACANVANLFLVRAEGRQREIAIRSALGAGRSVLVRALMTEALVLAAIGTVLGCAAAAAGVPALLRLAPPAIPRLDLVRLDGTVLAFAAAMAVVSALIFGLVPALRSTRQESLAALRHDRSGTSDPGRRRARNALVIAQTALALILLVGSGLLLRSFSRLIATDPGFDPRDAMTFRVDLPVRDYESDESAAAFTDRLVERLRALPGVQSAAAVSRLPIASSASGTTHEFEGHPVAAGQLPPLVHFKAVDRFYFDTMRIPVVSGRNFDGGDFAFTVHNAIVNRALADEFWPGEEAVGKRLRLASSSADPGNPPPWFTVIGIVGNERQDGLRRPVRPLVYYTPNPDAPSGVPRVMSYVVRGTAVETNTDALRQAVLAIDPSLPMSAVRSLAGIVDASIVQFTFTMVTLGVASALALLLGAVGLYGVLSYAVTLRTREIGVRLALGAPPARVLRAVVGNGALITGIGLVVGLGVAAAVTRYLGALLFETEPLDPAVFGAMSVALLIVAFAASYLPARRAAAVSPLEAMRTD